MAIPRSDFPFCPAQFRGAIQTDGPRSGVGHHPAAADHGDVHGGLRQSGGVVGQGDAVVSVLHERDRGVGVFCGLSDADGGHLHGQRRDHGKSLFPAAGDADLHGAHQPDLIHDPGDDVPAVLRVLPVAGGGAADLVSGADAAAGASDGVSGAGVRCDRFGADHEIPGLGDADRLRDAAVDVRHAGGV